MGKRSCRLFARLLGACVLLILWIMLIKWQKVVRRDSNDTSRIYLKILPWKNNKNDNALLLSTQPYLKILPRKNTKTSTESNIPRIFHQTWVSPELSVVFKPWIKSCIEQNPDWEYWFWTDKEMRDMVVEKYPKLLKMYDGYPQSIYRADAFRIFAVHQFGGVYADLDFECLQPLEKAIGQGSCFFSTEPEVHAEILYKLKGPLLSNGVFGCVPNHPFFSFIIQNLANNSRKRVLYATGPFLLSHLHKQNYSINQDRPTSGNGYDVPLSEWDIFQPTMDYRRVNDAKKTCRAHGSANATERRKRVCDKLLQTDFRNQPTRRSVTNNHWTHSWTDKRADRWGIEKKSRTFNITELTDTRNI